jgi:hypothetical protein
MTRADTILAAIIAELQRQSENEGNPFRHNGEDGDVDGSFDMVKLAQAIDAALK